jgi:hypothetical protein
LSYDSAFVGFAELSPEPGRHRQDLGKLPAIGSPLTHSLRLLVPAALQHHLARTNGQREQFDGIATIGFLECVQRHSHNFELMDRHFALALGPLRSIPSLPSLPTRQLPGNLPDVSSLIGIAELLPKLCGQRQDLGKLTALWSPLSDGVCFVVSSAFQHYLVGTNGTQEQFGGVGAIGFFKSGQRRPHDLELMAHNFTFTPRALLSGATSLA